MATHRLKLVPQGTNFDFIGYRMWGFAVFGGLTVASVVLLLVMGLNFGIDFLGGILIEARTPQAADIAQLRTTTNELGLGEVTLQQFGTDRDILIRVPQQHGGDAAQTAAADTVKQALINSLGSIEFRRIEFVGPQVGSELIRDGVLAVVLAIVAMLVYVWFRFEWQFGIGAVLGLLNVAITTLGVFAILRLEFNLPVVAAILTIIGYSMNDTVVIYDRIRENLRKYRSMELVALLNRSINDTLSRSVNTHFTTFLATLALLIFGGQAIREFAIAMLWGVVVGACTSVFVAAPVLIYLGLHRGVLSRGGEREPA